MIKSINKLFDIKHTIDNSSTPLSAEEIVGLTDIKIRTVQRYAMRLASEKLVGFRVREGESGYEYYGLGGV